MKDFKNRAFSIPNRVPRTRNNSVRRSNFAEIFQKFTAKSSNPKPIRRQSGYFDNTFYFQMFGMGILTLAIVISFQSFFQTNTAVSLEAGTEQDELRLLTNFQYTNDSIHGNARLQDAAVAQSQPQEAGIIAQEIQKQQQLELEKNTITHIVVEGESVYTIAANYEVLPQDIIERNSLIPPYTIEVGDELKIS